jgi:hypothetical protein
MRPLSHFAGRRVPMKSSRVSNDSACTLLTHDTSSKQSAPELGSGNRTLESVSRRGKSAGRPVIVLVRAGRPGFEAPSTTRVTPTHPTPCAVYDAIGASQNGGHTPVCPPFCRNASCYGVQPVCDTPATGAVANGVYTDAGTAAGMPRGPVAWPHQLHRRFDADVIRAGAFTSATT